MKKDGILWLEGLQIKEDTKIMGHNYRVERFKIRHDDYTVRDSQQQWSVDRNFSVVHCCKLHVMIMPMLHNLNGKKCPPVLRCFKNAFGI